MGPDATILRYRVPARPPAAARIGHQVETQAPLLPVNGETYSAPGLGALRPRRMAKRG